MDAADVTHSEVLQGEVNATLSLLDQAVELSGLAESTFCMRVLRTNYIRKKLVTGKITLERIAKLRRQLGDYIEEKRNDQSHCNESHAP